MILETTVVIEGGVVTIVCLMMLVFNVIEGDASDGKYNRGQG